MNSSFEIMNSSFEIMNSLFEIMNSSLKIMNSSFEIMNSISGDFLGSGAIRAPTGGPLLDSVQIRTQTCRNQENQWKLYKKFEKILKFN